MIPKIIHQTWKTKELPEEFKKWHNLIKNLHPGWDIKIWDDKENLELVKNYFPHLEKKYLDLEYNIMRADIVRYMYMAVYGGYYLDLDYELFSSFDKEISDIELLLPVSREKDKKGKITIGNCVFGSIKGHIFWKDILEDFASNPPLEKNYNKQKILDLTGPGFISKIYFRNPEKYNGTLLSRKIYHPDNTIISKYENYKEILQTNGSRGIHHCSATWLKNNRNLVNLIPRVFFSKEQLNNIKNKNY